MSSFGNKTLFRLNTIARVFRPLVIALLVLSSVLLTGLILPPSQTHDLPSASNHDRLGEAPTLSNGGFGSPLYGKAYRVATVDVGALPVSRVSGPTTIPGHRPTPPRNTSGSFCQFGVGCTPLANFTSSHVSNYMGFDGINQLQCLCRPPDVQVAAGPNSLVEMVNLQGEVFSKQGAPIQGPFNLSSFFHTSNDFISDPKILFDVPSGLWFASLLDVNSINNVTRSEVQLAVSKTSDPTGSWNIYSLGAAGLLPDQPIIGISDDKLVVSVNDYNPDVSVFLGAQFWILNKGELAIGAAAVDFASLGPTRTVESVHPVRSLSSTTTQFMMTVGASDMSVNNTVALLFYLTGLPPGVIGLQSIKLQVVAYQAPPAALQPGNSNLQIDTGDARIQDAVWSQGKLWYTFNDGCNPTQIIGILQPCIRFTQVDTSSGRVLQDFDLGSQNVFYPALSIDIIGNMAAVYGFSAGGSCCYPSIAVTGQGATDPAGTLRQPSTIKAGSAADSSGRYGDYFGAATDPSDQTLVWVAGEYHDNVTLSPSCGVLSQNSCWKTFIASMRVPTSGFTVSSQPTYLTIPTGSSAKSTIKVASLGGSAGTVSLSASISPSGPSVSLSTSSVTLASGGSGSSTLTVSTDGSTPAGTFVVTVTGVNGTMKVPATIIVSAVGFRISSSPNSFSFSPGASRTAGLTLASINGFSGTVTLSATVSPAGPSVSLSTGKVAISSGGSASSNLTISTLSSISKGIYTVSVTGKSGPESNGISIPTAVAPFSVTINSTASFTGVTVHTIGALSIDSPSNSLTISGTTSVTATNSTTGASLFSATYTVSLLPLAINSTGSYQATLLADIPVSPYHLSSDITVGISGTASSSPVKLSRNMDIDLNDLVDQADFNTAVAALGCSSGMPCYNPRADFLNHGVVDIVDISLLNQYLGSPDYIPDFSITGNSTALTIQVGATGTSTLTLSSINGFAATVNLSASVSPSGLALKPTGLNSSLSQPSMFLAGSKNLTVNVISASVGYYSVNIIASNGFKVHTVSIAVKVTDFEICNTASIALSCVGYMITMPVGSVAPVGIVLNGLDSFAGMITLATAASPTGLTTTLSSNLFTLTACTSINSVSCGTGLGSFTIAATQSTPTGTYTVTLTGTNGSLSHTISFRVTVTS